MEGAFAEHILELVSISVNKNTVPGEYAALNPSGLRIGMWRRREGIGEGREGGRE